MREKTSTQMESPDLLLIGDEPTEYEIALAMLRHALTFHPPSHIEVAGQGVVTGSSYLAAGTTGIWLSDPWGNLGGSTNLATLMRTGHEA
jgi:hypothetical protein